MALRDQPYLPLYIQDFLTDEKLMVCSAETTGVYIRLLCILHKQKEYGVFLLKQNVKQDVPTCLDFASQLDLFMPYKEKVIESAISELLLHDVIQQDGSKLLQKRMIIDNDISLKRASAGSKGGKKTQFAKANVKASAQANSEDESEDEDEVLSKDYNIEELKDYLHAELPELGLDAPLVSNMQFDLIDSFISECEVFQKLANWKIYVERIKESDWLMRRTTGKGQKKTKMGLKWLCKADTVRDVMAGNHDNVDTVSDGREWL
jgi:hypothetical protein